MDRRRFLTFIALSAAGGTAGCKPRRSLEGSATDHIEVARPDPSQVPPFDPLDPFGSTLERARALSKPLLVLTIPRGSRASIWSERGAELGDWLQHCTDEALLDLSRTEVLAATSEHVALYALGVREVLNAGREPRMWLVNTSQIVDRAIPVEVETSGRGRVAAYSASLRAALLAHGSSEDGVDRESRASVETLLAEMKERLRVQPPPGARWAHSGPTCVSPPVIEGTPRRRTSALSARCGMASLSDHAGRFLTFYSRG